MLPTKYALMIATLVLLPATAVAQDATTEAATFAIGIDGRAQAAAPGSTLTYHLYAKSRIDQALKLTADTRAEGYRVALSADALRVGPDAPAKFTLTVHVPDAAVPRAVVIVTATNEAGEAHRVEVIAEAKRPDAPRPVAKPIEPKPHANVTFALRVEPLRARPNASDHEEGAWFRVLVKARNASTIELSLRGAPDGSRLEPRTLDVPAGGEAVARLFIPKTDAPSKEPIVVIGTNGDETHKARVPLGKYDEDLRPLVHQLLARILRLEAALRAHGIHVEGEARAHTT